MGVRAETLRLPLLAPVPVAPAAPDGPVRFLFLGAWIPTKGPHVALEAFAGRGGAGRDGSTLTMAGPVLPWRGSSRWGERLQTRARQIPGVELRGAVPHEAVPGLLAAHDVLLFPSTWEENSPLVLLEAGAAGVRTLSSDSAGPRFVAPRARFVPAGEVPAWRSALEQEIAAGRRREAPLCPPAMQAHAGELLARYARLLRPFAVGGSAG
jgi:glycosyltransferase involved in cell wall biosynthesis